MDSFEGIIEFVAVAERRGFSAAAKQLGCSTSHVSRQVGRLEERLGVALLARTTRQVSLTENGTVYYHQAKNLVVGLQQVNEQVTQQNIQLEGTLRVSSAGGFAEHYLAPALMEFAASHPKLTIDIDFNSRLVNFLDEEIDFAIRYGELADSNLVARKLLDRKMMAVASDAYLQQHGIPTHPRDLKHHSCIIANNDNWKFIENGEPCIVKVKGRWRSNNTNVVVDACEQGLGIAYMPNSTFANSLTLGRVVPILEPFCSDSASSWIVYKNKRFMPIRVRLAIDYLVDYFADWEGLQLSQENI